MLMLALCASDGWAQTAEKRVGTGEPQRRVYVPVEELDTIIERDREGVILPRAKHRELWEAARRNRALVPPSSRPVVVAGAAYQARLNGQLLLIEASLDVAQLAPGWHALWLPLRNVAVEEAQLDGQPARLARGEGPERPLLVFMNEPGRHLLKLNLATPLAAQGSDRVAAFGVPEVSAASLRLEVPRGKQVYLDDALVEPAAEQTGSVEVAVGGRGSLSLRWTDQRAERESATLVFAATAIGLHVAPEERTWRAMTSLAVFGKPIDALTFTIPKSLQMISVESPGLERWELEEPAQGTVNTLRLVYRQPFRENRLVTMQGVSASELGQPWSVPTLLLGNATSHVVRVLVQSSGEGAGLRLQLIEASAARRIEPDEAITADMPSSPDMAVRVEDARKLHFAAWREDFALVFLTLPRARELWATITTRLDATSREVALAGDLRVHSRFAPLFDLDLLLPAEWIIDEVTSGGAPADWRIVPHEAGRNLVRVVFQPPVSAEGAASLRVRARLASPEGLIPDDKALTIAIPEIELPQVTVSSGRYLLAADSDLDLAPEELAGLDPLRLTDAELQVAGNVRLAYEYQDSRVSGTLRVSRKPLRMTAALVAFHRLDRQALNSHLEARLVLHGGGARRLQLALPESAGTDLRFRVVGPPEALARESGAPMPAMGAPLPEIIEQSAAPAAEGQRLWTLEFDQRVLGEVWLATDLQRPTQPDAAAASYELPALRVPAADRQFAHVAVEASADQRLALEAFADNGVPLAEVDAADLPLPVSYVPSERIVAAFQAPRPGYRVSMTEVRYARHPVPTAVCDSLELATNLGETGELHHQAEFRLRAIGVQSLALDLVPEAELWAALVDNQPMEVRISRRGDKATYLLPLPPVEPPEAPRRVVIHYSTLRPAITSAGSLRETAPQIAAVTGEGAEQPIEVLNRGWALHVPLSVDVISSTGAFEPADKLSRTSLLGRLQQAIRLESPRVIGKKTGAVAAAIGVVLLVVLFQRRFGSLATLGAAVLAGVLLAAAFWLVPAARMARQSMAPAAAFRAGDSAQAVAQPMPGPGGFGGAKNDEAVRAVRRSEVQFNEAAERMEARDAESLIVTHEAVDELEQAASRTRADERQPAAKPGAMVEQLKSALPAEPKPAEGREAPAPQAAVDGPAAPPVAEAAAPPGRQAVIPAAGQPASGAGPGHSSIRKGLLSLAIDLQPAPNSRKTTFRFQGADAFAGLPALEIELQSARQARFTTIAWQFGLLVAFWLMRNWPVPRRGAVAALGLAVPWACVPLAPLGALPHVDGVFLGTAWGVALWFVLWAGRSVHILPRRWRGAVVLAIATALCALCACASSARAQSTAPESRSAPPGSPSQAVSTIVVPYDPQHGPLAAESVFMPFDAFLELWNAANPERLLEAPPAVDGVVAQALYAARIIPARQPGQRAAVEVAARMVLHSFRETQVTVGLPLGQVALDSSKLDGAGAPLVTRETGSGPVYEAVLSKRGAHVLDLVFNLAAETAGPSGRFTLPLLPVAAGALRLTLPAEDLALRITGGNGIYRLGTSDGRPTATIPIDQGGPLTVAWAPRQTQAAADLTVHATGTMAIMLDDSGLRMPSLFRFAVRQGSVSELNFSVPSGLLVRQIAGLDLAGWELAGDEPQRTLRVFLRRAVSDETTLQFDLFEARAITEESQSIAVPAFVPLGATRETGTLGVIASRQFAVSAGATAGLAQIEASQFQVPPGMGQGTAASANAALMATPPQLAYRYVARPYQLQLLVARRKPQTQAIAEHAVLVNQRKVQYSSRMEVRISGAPRSEITVQLPEGFLLHEVNCHDAVDYFVEGAAESGAQNPNLLHVELASPRTGTVELIINGAVPRLAEDPFAQVLVPLPTEVAELRSTLAVWLAEGLTGRLEDSSGWKSIDPARLPARLRSARPVEVQFALSSQIAAIQPVGLTLDQVAPRLSADSLVEVLVRDASINYVVYLRWSIARAGAQTFVFTTPDWLAGRLELHAMTRGARIRQLTREPVARNRLRWTVTLDELQSGVLALVGSASVASPETGRVAAPSVIFEEAVGGEAPRPWRELEDQRAYLVLVNQSRQRMVQDAPASVEALTADDLPISLGTMARNEATEVLQVRDRKGDVGWQMQPLAQVKAIGAAVNHARLTLVLARDGSWRAQADYQINNRSRQFLALRMPPQARVLSLFLAGAPARPIDPVPAASDLLLIPLPKGAAGDLSTSVSLVFAGSMGAPLPKGVQIARSELDLPAPQVVSPAEDPQFGMPVASTEWTIYLPDDLDAVKIDDPARSNMAESEAGLELQIALFQEWLNLYGLLEDRSSSRETKLRAASNLKQLGTSLGDYRQNIGRLAASKSEAARRQERDLRDLAEKYERARSMLGAQTASIEREVSGKLNAFFAQQELIAGNTIDFAPADARDTVEGLRQILESAPAQDATKSPQDKPQRGLRRAELSKQLAEQSQALNSQLRELARNEPGGPQQARHLAEQGSLAGAQALADAEDALNKTRRMGQQRADLGNQPVADGRGFAGELAPGGLAGGGAGAQPALDDLVEFAAAGTPWNRAGGLSLKIELPSTANRLTFSRPGGEPRLALGLRPKTSLESAFGLAWAATWLLLAAGLVAAFARGESVTAAKRGVPFGMVVTGLAWFYLLPGAWLGFALFTAGALLLGYRYRRV